MVDRGLPIVWVCGRTLLLFYGLQTHAQAGLAFCHLLRVCCRVVRTGVLICWASQNDVCIERLDASQHRLYIGFDNGRLVVDGSPMSPWRSLDLLMLHAIKEPPSMV